MIRRDVPINRLRTFAIFAIGIAGYATVVGPLAALRGIFGSAWIPAAETTALVSMIAAHLAMRQIEVSGITVIRSLVLFAGAAVLNFGVLWIGSSLAQGHPGWIPWVVYIVLIGVVIAGPIGILFGGLYLVPIVFTQREREVPSCFGYDRGAAITWGWLSAIVIISACFANAVAAALLGVVALATVCAAAFHGHRFHVRRRWLARVAADLEPHWCLRDPATVEVRGTLPRLDRVTMSGPAQILCARSSAAGGPYRDIPTIEPLAWVGVSYRPLGATDQPSGAGNVATP